MVDSEDSSSEIPDFIKKYVPAVSRGLSWAKYSNDKSKGTALKSEILNESKSEGYVAAFKAPKGTESNYIRDKTLKEMWSKADELTEEARKISLTINNQKSKEERDKVLDLARIAARKAGMQAAIATGWEKGWNEGIAKRDSE